MAETLTREEREGLMEALMREHGWPMWSDIDRYEATVVAMEAEVARLRGALEEIANGTPRPAHFVAQQALADRSPEVS